MGISQSGSPPKGGGSHHSDEQRAFFSPASSIALDFSQFVMEAKSIEQESLAPTPSNYDFTPTVRQDVIVAEESLNSIDFSEAQKLAIQIMGVSPATKMSFSIPSYKRKINSEKNEQLVSDLRSFGKNPSGKMSVNMQTSSTPVPFAKKPKTRGGSLLSGLLSKLKFGSKKKSTPIITPSQNVGIIKSIPKTNPISNKPYFGQPQKTPVHAESGQITNSHEPRPNSPTIPTPKKATPTSPSSKVQEPSNSNKLSVTNSQPGVQTPTKTPSEDSADLDYEQPHESPVIKKPKQRKEPKPQTSASEQTPEENIINVDTFGDAPLISPKRRYFSQSASSTQSPFSEQPDEIEAPKPTAKKKPPTKSQAQKKPAKKRAPAKTEEISSVSTQLTDASKGVMHMDIPHFGTESYVGVNTPPTSELSANYNISEQIENATSTKEYAPTKQKAKEITNIPKPPVKKILNSEQKKISPPKIKKKKKSMKPLSSRKSPPSIPTKKTQKQTQKQPNAIDELESVAGDFSKSVSKKKKSLLKKPKPSVSKTTTKPSVSSSLAKRLGINTSPSINKQNSDKKISNAPPIADEQNLDSDLQAEKNPEQNSSAKISNASANEITKPKISNVVDEALTPPKKQVDQKKQVAANLMADELLFAYAKENHKWLYEIYKMGGLSIDEFRKKIKEKIDADKGDGSSRDITTNSTNKSSADNEAFSNLSSAADKKFKK